MHEIREFIKDTRTTMTDAKFIFDLYFSNELAFQNSNSADFHQYQLLHQITRSLESLGGPKASKGIDFATFTNTDRIDSLILDVRDQKQEKADRYA